MPRGVPLKMIAASAAVPFGPVLSGVSAGPVAPLRSVPWQPAHRWKKIWKASANSGSESSAGGRDVRRRRRRCGRRRGRATRQTGQVIHDRIQLLVAQRLRQRGRHQPLLTGPAGAALADVRIGLHDRFVDVAGDILGFAGIGLGPGGLAWAVSPIFDRSGPIVPTALATPGMTWQAPQPPFWNAAATDWSSEGAAAARAVVGAATAGGDVGLDL